MEISVQTHFCTNYCCFCSGICVYIYLYVSVFTPSSWAAGLGYFPRNVLDSQREADAFLFSQRRPERMWRVAWLVILNTPCALCMWLFVCAGVWPKNKHGVRHLVVKVQYFKNSDRNQPCKLWLIVFFNNENKTLFNLWSARMFMRKIKNLSFVRQRVCICSYSTLVCASVHICVLVR